MVLVIAVRRGQRINEPSTVPVTRPQTQITKLSEPFLFG